jgi:hypothetical protein
MYISSTYEYSFFVEMFLTRRIYKVFFTSDDSGYHSMSLLCKSFDFSITLAHVLPLQISLFRLESTSCSSSCPFILFSVYYLHLCSKMQLNIGVCVVSSMRAYFISGAQNLYFAIKNTVSRRPLNLSFMMLYHNLCCSSCTLSVWPFLIGHYVKKTKNWHCTRTLG